MLVAASPNVIETPAPVPLPANDPSYALRADLARRLLAPAPPAQAVAAPSIAA